MKTENEEENDGAMPAWMQKFIILFLDYEVALHEHIMELSDDDSDKLFETDLCDGMNNLGDMLGIPKDQPGGDLDLPAITKELGLPKGAEVDHPCVCELATIAGKWPESVYCRDWLYDIPSSISKGESTIEESLDDLRIDYGLRHRA